MNSIAEVTLVCSNHCVVPIAVREVVVQARGQVSSDLDGVTRIAAGRSPLVSARKNAPSVLILTKQPLKQQRLGMRVV
jgi:hypothetical protein